MSAVLSRDLTERLAVTPQELYFCDLICLQVEPKLAAEQAGLQDHHARVLKRPAVRAVLRERHAATLEGLLLPASTKALHDVLTGAMYTGASKVSAVKLVWSAAGLLPVGVKAREPHEPDPSVPAPQGVDAPGIKGVEGSLRQMQSALADLHKRLTAAEPIDVTPRPSSPIDL